MQWIVLVVILLITIRSYASSDSSTETDNSNRENSEILDELFPQDSSVPELPRQPTSAESKAIEHGVDFMKSKNNKRGLFKKKKELLCVTFAQAKVYPLVVLTANIAHSRSYCDWAVIFYGGDRKLEDMICEKEEYMSSVVFCGSSSQVRNSSTLEITEACYANVTSKNLETFSAYDAKNRRNIPKPVMYVDLLPLLPRYKKVIMMDEDISIQNFNISRALKIWNCAFEHPPMIMQPLIYESRQYYSFVGYRDWQSRYPKNNVLASSVGLVEQQVPMFSSIFLEWLIRYVISETVACSKALGVDWGMDRMWCTAASHFGREVLGWKNYRTPCGLIVGGEYVRHLDTRSITNKRKNPTVFREKGRIIVKKYQKLFPSWMFYDYRKINPLDRRYGDNYPKKRELSSSCWNH